MNVVEEQKSDSHSSALDSEYIVCILADIGRFFLYYSQDYVDKLDTLMGK